MNSCFRAVVFAFVVCLGNITLAQTKLEKESLKVRVIKVERTQDDQDGNLWYKIKLVFKDNGGRVYHVWTACITTNPDSPVSCGKYVVPRAGLSYDILNYGDVTIQFAGSQTFYQVASVEISECNENSN